jgi:hypothetical protein
LSRGQGGKRLLLPYMQGCMHPRQMLSMQQICAAKQQNPAAKQQNPAALIKLSMKFTYFWFRKLSKFK